MLTLAIPLEHLAFLTGDPADAREYYFVIETKSTNNLEDRKALTDSERWKISASTAVTATKSSQL